MEIAFRVRGVEVPESVRHRTRDRVIRLAALCGTERAVVSFSAERNPRIAEREVCQIVLFGRGRGATLRVHAAATDVTVAADRVVAKLEQRAARLRGRAGRRRPQWCSATLWRGHSLGPSLGLPLGSPAAAFAACGDHWVHFPPNRSTARWEPGAVDLVVGGPGEVVTMGIGGLAKRRTGGRDLAGRDPGAREPATGGPARGERDDGPMTPEEAALEMADQGREMYFFLNAETGRPAVVYSRADGDIAFHDAADAPPDGLRW
jgi:ribosome-associated translation inhibitor RaiA